jgi:hypothetical protein
VTNYCTCTGKSQLHTETAVEAAEFNEYVLSPAQHSADASVQLVFSIKEVKVREKR